MKNLIQFIKESTIDDSNKYYMNIDDLENGQQYFVVLCSDENGEPKPIEVIFKKEGKEFTFANPDDDREMFDWHDLINSTSGDENSPKIAIFKTEKEAKNFCKLL